MFQLSVIFKLNWFMYQVKSSVNDILLIHSASLFILRTCPIIVIIYVYCSLLFIFAVVQELSRCPESAP